MAKATITTSEGISIQVIGTPEEVASVVEKLRSRAGQGPLSPQGHRQTGSKGTKVGRKVLIADLIAGLKQEEFFKTPRGLGEVRQKLADIGHHYPVTTLSGAMQSQAKTRQLRRFKKDGKYVYAQ